MNNFENAVDAPNLFLHLVESFLYFLLQGFLNNHFIRGNNIIDHISFHEISQIIQIMSLLRRNPCQVIKNFLQKISVYYMYRLDLLNMTFPSAAYLRHLLIFHLSENQICTTMDILFNDIKNLKDYLNKCSLCKVINIIRGFMRPQEHISPFESKHWFLSTEVLPESESYLRLKVNLCLYFIIVYINIFIVASIVKVQLNAQIDMER